MKKLLILENNKGEEKMSHRVALETTRAALEKCGIHLERKVAETKPAYSGDPKNDIIYCGRTSSHSWDICLRTVYVPPEYGTDYFEQKITRIIKAYRPDCIFCHLALYGRGARYLDYPAVNVLLPYAEKIEIVVYTGTADDQESLIADTDGRIKYCFNNRDIDTQINFIMELLH